MSRFPLSAGRPSRGRVLHYALVVAQLCAVAGGVGAPAQAQPADAMTSSSRRYDIAAGPLEQALARFMAESGTPLASDPALLATRDTAGLQGEFTAGEALSRLLQGSGLVAEPLSQGGFVLRLRPVGGEVATLSAITVSARGDGMTEHSGSYTTGSTSTATRLVLSLRETPQSLTVVTRQKIDDFALTDMNDVLESTSSVVVASQGADGANFFSRGFGLQMQYEGMSNPVGIGESNSNPSPDSAFIDHVEILQGAAGLLSGAGQPGGTVNLVRKRPTAAGQMSWEALAGSWDRRRLVGDVSGPLLESGRLRARLVALWDESDSFMDYAYDRKKGVYGVIEADLAETTLLTVDFQWQRNEGNNHLGVPTNAAGGDLRLRRSSFFAGANDGIDKAYRIYTVGLQQRLGAGWSVQARYSHNQTDVDNASSYLYGTLDEISGDGLKFYQQLLKRDFRSDSYDVYASGPLELLGREHELVLGMNGSRMKEKTRGYYGSGRAVNIYRFDPDVPRPDAPLGEWSVPNETRQRGLYGVARLNLAEPLKLIVGSRVSWYEYLNAGVRAQKESAVVTPYAGLVLDLDAAHSAYASYSDIFKPQSELQSSGSTVDPVVGKNYEIGVKGEYYGGRLNASAGLFRLEQNNLAQIDTRFPYDEAGICRGYCYNASGLVVSKGVDLSLAGEVHPGWQLGLAYTYVHSEHAKGADKGKPYATQTPDHVVRLYTTYRVPGTALTLGGNVKAQSRISNSGEQYKVRQGGYAIVALMAKYQVNARTEVGLTLDNLFDRRYYSAVGDPWFYTFYGSPRRATLNLKYQL